MTIVFTADSLRDMQSIAQRIRWILVQRQWSERELSEYANLSPVHVGKILERGGGRVSAETLAAIARASGYSLWWLTTGEGSPTEGAPARAPGPEDAEGQTGPRYGYLEGWEKTLETARAMAKDVPPDVWERMGSFPPLITEQPTVAEIINLARHLAQFTPPSQDPNVKSRRRRRKSADGDN